jgi:hypothetical protein
LRGCGLRERRSGDCQRGQSDCESDSRHVNPLGK